jgi:hypothetical protein
VRTLLVAVLLAGCSSGKHPSNPAEDQIAEVPSLAPPDAVVLDRLIAPHALSIERRLPPLAEVPTWQPRCGSLDGALVAAYRLAVPSGTGLQRVTYKILEGELPASCFDGDPRTAIRKAPFTVIGPSDIVGPVTASTSTAPSRWHDLLAAVPPKAPYWLASEDRAIEKLIGVATTRYAITFERLELSPNIYFSGQATLIYAAPGDAAIVARRIKSGEVTLPVDAPAIRDSFKRMRVKQNGPVVVVRFDLGMFGGVTAEQLATIASALRP